MPRTSGGDKRSSWQVFHRRLFVVRRLIRGPASADTLIAEARLFFGDPEIYPPSDGTALRHDLSALRGEFECQIERDVLGRYVLGSPGRLALLDLADTDLESLAFLVATFRDSTLPNAPQVDALLDRIMSLLPDERRAALERPRRDVRLDHPQPSAATPDHTLRQLRRALHRQEVAFTYRSSYAGDGTVVQHRVAPYDLLFRDGHTYLDGFCLDCGVADMSRRYRLYRLDRIVGGSLQILPTRLAPVAPPRPTYRLRYRLSATVARQRDIALWFPGSQVEWAPDGAALVTGRTTDLWQARQILLRYREHCQVLDPPELIEMLRDSLRRMQAIYVEESQDA